MHAMGEVVGALYFAVKTVGRMRAVRQRDRLQAGSYTWDIKLSAGGGSRDDMGVGTIFIS